MSGPRSPTRRRLAEVLARIARRIATENPNAVTNLAGGAAFGTPTTSATGAQGAGAKEA